jgi:hypothetical protein
MPCASEQVAGAKSNLLMSKGMAQSCMMFILVV